MLTNQNFHFVLADHSRIDRMTRYMSSGTPICPICQKEHNDSDYAFDTLTPCDNCNIRHGFTVNPRTIKKLYGIFARDPLAYHHRKAVLKKLIEQEPRSVWSGPVESPRRA